MTPASPKYCAVAENWAAVFVTGFGVTLEPVGGTACAEAGPATAVRAANATMAAMRPNFLILLRIAKVSSFFGGLDLIDLRLFRHGRGRLELSQHGPRA